MRPFDYSIQSPDDSGLQQHRIDNLTGRVGHAIGKGPLPSVQIAMARENRLALFRTWAEQDNNWS